MTGLHNPQTVNRDDIFTGHEKVVQQVVLQDELDSLVVGLTKLVSPALELATQGLLLCERGLG